MNQRIKFHNCPSVVGQYLFPYTQCIRSFLGFHAQKYGHLLKRCILKRLCIHIESKRIQYE